MRILKKYYFMSTLQTCRCQGYTYITYEQYCICIDEVLSQNKKMSDNDKRKFKHIIDFLSAFKQKAALQLKLMKISFKDLIIAMTHRDFYAVLNMLKFDLSQLLKALGSIQRLIAQGILKILADITSKETMILFRAKVIKIDDFIKLHPILKYLTGAALCGLLIWMWINMTFIGDFDFDFDLQIAISALLGSYSLSDLLATEDGLLFLTLFFTGIATPISFNWLLGTPVLVPIMLTYSIYKNPTWQSNIKNWVKTSSQKVSTTMYKYQKTRIYNVYKLK